MHTPERSPKIDVNREMTMRIPEDPVMLLSFVNTQLRDFDQSLEAFCERYEISPEEIIRKLDLIDYHYDSKTNRFI